MCSAALIMIRSFFRSVGWQIGRIVTGQGR